MKATIKKISIAEGSDYWKDEWLVCVDKKTIAICFTEEDAKFIARCIRKYKPKKD